MIDAAAGERKAIVRRGVVRLDGDKCKVMDVCCKRVDCEVVNEGGRSRSRTALGLCSVARRKGLRGARSRPEPAGRAHQTAMAAAGT